MVRKAIRRIPHLVTREANYARGNHNFTLPTQRRQNHLGQSFSGLTSPSKNPKRATLPYTEEEVDGNLIMPHKINQRALNVLQNYEDTLCLKTKANIKLDWRSLKTCGAWGCISGLVLCTQSLYLAPSSLPAVGYAPAVSVGYRSCVS